MDVNRVKRTDTPSYSIHAVGNSGGKSTGFFQQQLGEQMKEDYKRRFTVLFDEIIAESATILEHADLSKFEQYRGLIRELLQDVLKNAYHLHSERVLDFSGKQRIYEMVHIVDDKLDDLAKEILVHSRDRINYLSQIDEIRGLIMDLLF